MGSLGVRDGKGEANEHSAIVAGAGLVSILFWKLIWRTKVLLKEALYYARGE